MQVCTGPPSPLPDQHARLADGAIPDPGPGRPRWTTFRTRELDRVAGMGFDWVWLLSVWQHGTGRAAGVAREPEWRREFEETLPDLREDDIAGSGFAITGYTVHPEPRRGSGAGAGCASVSGRAGSG